jgi:hypothetical protein
MAPLLKSSGVLATLELFIIATIIIIHLAQNKLLDKFQNDLIVIIHYIITICPRYRKRTIIIPIFLSEK